MATGLRGLLRQPGWFGGVVGVGVGVAHCGSLAGRSRRGGLFTRVPVLFSCRHIVSREKGAVCCCWYGGRRVVVGEWRLVWCVVVGLKLWIGGWVVLPWAF
jgi:hypothetical protein